MVYHSTIKIKTKQASENARYCFNCYEEGKGIFNLTIHDNKTGHLAQYHRSKLLHGIVKKYINKLEYAYMSRGGLYQCAWCNLTQEEVDDIMKTASVVKMRKSKKKVVESKPYVLKKPSEYTDKEIDISDVAFRKILYNKPYKEYIKKNKENINPYRVWFNLIEYGKINKFERAFGEKLPLIMEVYKMYDAYTEDKLEEYFKNFEMERFGKTDLNVLQEVQAEIEKEVVEYIKNHRKGDYSIEDITTAISDEVFEHTCKADQKMYQEIQKGGLIYKEYVKELTGELKEKYMRF